MNNALFRGKNDGFLQAHLLSWQEAALRQAQGKRAAPRQARDRQAAVNSQKSWHWSKGTEFVTGPRYQLREPGVCYHIDFGPKNSDIGAENGYFWNNNIENSI